MEAARSSSHSEPTCYTRSESVSAALNRLKVITLPFPALKLSTGCGAEVNFSSQESWAGGHVLYLGYPRSPSLSMLLLCITPYFAYVYFPVKPLINIRGNLALYPTKKLNLEISFWALVLKPGLAHMLEGTSAALTSSARNDPYVQMSSQVVPTYTRTLILKGRPRLI